MKNAAELATMTAEQKVHYFADLFAATCEGYTDAETGLLCSSLESIFDNFIEVNRLRYGSENKPHIINGARLSCPEPKKVYRNTQWTKRDYECTNVVACVAESAPAANWVESDEHAIHGLTALYRQGNVAYFGYL